MDFVLIGYTQIVHNHRVWYRLKVRDRVSGSFVVSYQDSAGKVSQRGKKIPKIDIISRLEESISHRKELQRAYSGRAKILVKRSAGMLKRDRGVMLAEFRLKFLKFSSLFSHLTDYYHLGYMQYCNATVLST